MVQRAPCFAPRLHDRPGGFPPAVCESGASESDPNTAAILDRGRLDVPSGAMLRGDVRGQPSDIEQTSVRRWSRPLLRPATKH
jgi:hypothetical protein